MDPLSTSIFCVSYVSANQRPWLNSGDRPDPTSSDYQYTTWKEIIGAEQTSLSIPFTAFLARIRKLIIADDLEHCTAIERGFRDGSLRQPVSPMSDAELGEAIAEQRAPY